MPTDAEGDDPAPILSASGAVTSCHMIFAVGEWGNGRLESPDGAHCVYIGGSTGGLTRELVDKRQPPSFLDFITCMLASALVLAVARP